MEKLLHDIRQAENMANTIVAEAKEKVAQILSQAKTDANAFLIERKQTLLAEKTAALTLRKKELEKEQQKYLKKAEKQAEGIRVVMSRNKKKVLPLLLHDFKKCLQEIDTE